MRGIGAGTRIFELLDRTPAVQPGEGVVLAPARFGPIRFENVTFSYPTRRGVNVLEDFDLEVNVGENVAIVYVLPVLLWMTGALWFINGIAGRVGAASRRYILSY
jgi:hypothetical protein